MERWKGVKGMERKSRDGVEWEGKERVDNCVLKYRKVRTDLKMERERVAGKRKRIKKKGNGEKRIGSRLGGGDEGKSKHGNENALKEKTGKRRGKGREGKRKK